MIWRMRFVLFRISQSYNILYNILLLLKDENRFFFFFYARRVGFIGKCWC